MAIVFGGISKNVDNKGLQIVKVLQYQILFYLVSTITSELQTIWYVCLMQSEILKLKISLGDSHFPGEGGGAQI